MQSKASTISSGARAAAQTLNVPIERLEAQVHSSGKPSPTSPVPNHGSEKPYRHHSDEIIPSHLEHNGKAHQQHVYQQQEAAMKLHHGGVASPKNGFMNGNGADIDAIMLQDELDENQSSLTPSPANAKYTLLQFALQHFRDE